MSLVSNSALSFVQLLKKKEWVAKNKMKTKEEGNILLNRQFVLVQRAAGAQSTGFLLLEKTDPPLELLDAILSSITNGKMGRRDATLKSSFQVFILQHQKSLFSHTHTHTDTERETSE
jgi:hypothetical protein